MIRIIVQAVCHRPQVDLGADCDVVYTWPSGNIRFAYPQLNLGTIWRPAPNGVDVRLAGLSHDGEVAACWVHLVDVGGTGNEPVAHH